ncbi:hypothetical protein [Methylacidimicrobium tartarophylax]|uniref:Uncharacterized protein n=1 Tax=Methylacidimicrobium tartarophylax TaxID=1041768 RepID=A0A5E6MFF2_9BACT|nr:hypothetical protein [Methylacidimicrobium tartarophylax]VVM06573.1 hypothetical protein MAMT_01285 [Methylacidimicrobium tartarophylax]
MKGNGARRNRSWVGWLLLGLGVVSLLIGAFWRGSEVWRARQVQASQVSLQKRVGEARDAVARLRDAAERGEGLSEAGRQFQDRIEDLSLSEEIRRGIAREAAWVLLQKASTLSAEAAVYRREESDHPHLTKLLSQLRALRTQAFPLLAAGLPPVGVSDGEQCRHKIFYAKGLLDAWVADLETDAQRQVESWLAAVSELAAALKEAPEDPWTIENLEVLGSTFHSTLGRGQVQAGGEKPGKKDLQKPEEASPLPQRQGHAPSVPKGKM